MYWRTLLGLLLAASTASAADWPQWLGLHRDSATAEKVAPWTSPLKVAWKQPVGDGFRRRPVHAAPLVNPDELFAFEFGLLLELPGLAREIRTLRIGLRAYGHIFTRRHRHGPGEERGHAGDQDAGAAGIGSGDADD